MDGYFVLPCAVENGLPGFLGKILHRRIQSEAVLLPHGSEVLSRNAVILLRIEAHGVQCALAEAFAFVREEDVRADLHPCA